MDEVWSEWISVGRQRLDELYQIKRSPKWRVLRSH